MMPGHRVCRAPSAQSEIAAWAAVVSPTSRTRVLEGKLAEIELGAAPGGSARLRGYVARPEGDGPWPGMVVIHEAFGLDDVMRRQADRLARSGYLTLVPDLYSDGSAARCVLGMFRALITAQRGAGTGKRRDGKPFTDIEAARTWLLDQGDCTGRVGLIGFCMGGGFALLAADAGFDAASANYGPVATGDLESVLRGACPLIAVYGGKEPGAARTVRRIDTALTVLNVEHEVAIYPQAGHAFLNETQAGPALLRPLLRVSQIKPEPSSAQDAWRRIDAFLDRHLK
jgi:carboxymethylenebutenolidase